MAKNTAGRPGLTQNIFNLLMLALSLINEPGYRLADKTAVATRLGLDVEATDRLFAMLEILASEEVLPVPLEFSKDGSEVSAEEKSEIFCKLRLTPAEWDAVSEALESLGIPRENPFHQALYAAAGPYDPEASPMDFETPEVIESLSRLTDAIPEGQPVTFDYVHVGSDVTQRRHVLPVELHPNAKRLYLKALDYDRGGQVRNFLVNNISHVTLEASRTLPESDAENNIVTLTFSDPIYYNLFEWNDSVVKSRPGETTVVIDMPWFGNDWLPRRIRACRGTCTTNSAELDERVAALSREPLPTVAP
jgi:hypothetical protein